MGIHKLNTYIINPVVTWSQSSISQWQFEGPKLDIATSSTAQGIGGSFKTGNK